MPNINLISARREEKKKVERLTRQLFMGFAGTVGVLALVIVYVGARQVTARAALRDAETRWAAIKPKLDRIEELKKAQTALGPKVETLQQAKAETMRWRAILQAVSQAMPQEAWLSGMATVGSGDDMTLNLTGFASSQSMVGETMSRIGQQPIFDGVELRVTTQMPKSPTELTTKFSFDIGAHLKAPMNELKTEDTTEATQKADATEGNGGSKNG